MESSEFSKEYYQREGYAVARNLVPAGLIDDLLREYSTKIVPSRKKFYRQSTSRYETNALTSHGYVRQSFLDIHDYRGFRDFSARSRLIFFHPAVHQALREITGAPAHNLMQTMLFDANTATIPHQDWWYLDTVPQGGLTAVWIALEDIHEKAGRFFVMPKSLREDFFGAEGKALPHTEWLKRIKAYFDTNPGSVLAPALRKGDAIFWNSGTVHGSLPTGDPSFSRKSLTAHYIPEGAAFGNLFVKKDYVEYREHGGMKFYRNQPDYNWYQDMKNRVKVAVYDHPALIRGMRKIQKALRNA